LLPDPNEDGKSNKLFPEVPDFITKAFKENPKAETNFNALATSYRLQYLGWIMSAKKHETQITRLKEALQLLNAGMELKTYITQKPWLT
jgi:uncharacterized protein YdeI (YjbR/CyaY-like superfamily)